MKGSRKNEEKNEDKIPLQLYFGVMGLHNSGLCPAIGVSWCGRIWEVCQGWTRWKGD
jgi:hypothetical protein